MNLLRFTLTIGCLLVYAMSARVDAVQLINPLPRPILPDPGGILKLPPIVSPTPGGLIQLEAETFSLSEYRVEDNDIASGGSFISLLGVESDVGVATTTFPGESGSYTVVVNYLDEEDGEGQIDLLANEKELGSLFLDRHLGESGPGKDAFTARTLGAVTIDQGDRITIRGTRTGGEQVRVDFVQFIPTGSIRQAEQATLPPESIVKTDQPGFTGSGYVQTPGESFIQWSINVPRVAEYTLEFRYSQAEEDITEKPLDLFVNGSLVISKLQFRNTAVNSRWLTEKAIVKLKEGSNILRVVTTGQAAADMDYVSVYPVRFINARGSVASLRDPYRPEHGDPRYSDTYYGRMDPNGTRKTLEAWKSVNGFSNPSLPVISASYINAFDLGFGREMHCRETGAGRPACYVDNYLDPRGESRLVATVAMETRSDPATDRQFTAFYAFDSEGRRINSAALDSEGPKKIPESCYACHMGYTNSTAFPKTEHGGLFLPFDQNLYENWPGKPTVAAQSSSIATLNALIWNWGKWFDGSIKDLIGGWYDASVTTNFDENGNRTFNNAFDDGYIPGTWLTQGAGAGRLARERQLYTGVYAKYCRTCHIAQGEWGVFTRDEDQSGIDWDKAVDFWKRAYSQICEPGDNQPIMPHAELTLSRFNTDLHTFAVGGGLGSPTLLAKQKRTARDFLCSQSPPDEGDKAAGKAKFQGDACKGCHKTRDVDGGAIDLTCRGVAVVVNLGTINPQMNGMTLTAQEVQDMSAYLDSFPECS